MFLKKRPTPAAPDRLRRGYGGANSAKDRAIMSLESPRTTAAGEPFRCARCG